MFLPVFVEVQLAARLPTRVPIPLPVFLRKLLATQILACLESVLLPLVAAILAGPLPVQLTREVTPHLTRRGKSDATNGGRCREMANPLFVTSGTGCFQQGMCSRA